MTERASRIDGDVERDTAPPPEFRRILEEVREMGDDTVDRIGATR
jgi:hypothetical protein